MSDDDRIEFVFGQLGEMPDDVDAVGMMPGQVPWAMPNGTRIMKVKSEPGDSSPIGAKGTVVSSIHQPEAAPNVFYWVLWDYAPGIPVGVIDWKIGPA